MNTAKIIGAVICIIFALIGLGGPINGRPGMITGTFIFGSIAYLLLKNINKKTR